MQNFDSLCLGLIIIWENMELHYIQMLHQVTRGQRANGPHLSPEEPVQINKHIYSKLWLYHNVNFERRKPIFSLFMIKWSLYVKFEYPSPKDALCLAWLVLIISPWKRGGLIFEQTSIPFTQGCFVPSLVKIGRMVLEKKIFRFQLEKGMVLRLNKPKFPLPKNALC